MSKSHRGKGIRDQVKNGRGLCPQCKIENIKVLYDHDLDGQKVKVCKFCNAAIKNKKKAEAPVVAPAPVVEKAAEVVEAPAKVVEAPAEDSAK